MINSTIQLILTTCIFYGFLTLIGFAIYDIILHKNFKRLLNGEIVWKPLPIANLSSNLCDSSSTINDLATSKLQYSELAPDTLIDILKPYQEKLFDLIINKQHIVKIDYNKEKVFEHVFKDNKELKALIKKLALKKFATTIPSIIATVVLIPVSHVTSVTTKIAFLALWLISTVLAVKIRIDITNNFNYDAKLLLNKQMGTSLSSIDNFVKQDSDNVTDGLYTLVMLMEQEFDGDAFLANNKVEVYPDLSITNPLPGLINHLISNTTGYDDPDSYELRRFISNRHADAALLESLPYILLANQYDGFKETYDKANNKLKVVKRIWNFNQAAYGYLNLILHSDIRDNCFYKRNYKTAEQMINVLQLALTKNELDEKLITLSDELNNKRLIDLIKKEVISNEISPATTKILRFMATTGYQLSQVLIDQIKIFLDYSAQDSVAIKEDNRISINLDDMDTDTLLEHYEQMQKDNN